MIWITTLCLLCVVAWLLFNALNERRWVKAHSHDETVASDEGLLYSFSSATGSGDGQESVFGKTLTKVRDGGAKFDQRLKEKLHVDRSTSNPSQTDSGETLFERTTKKVAATSENISQKVSEHAKNISQGEGVFGNMSDKVSSGMSRARAGVTKAAGEGEDLVTRISKKVGNKVGEMDGKLRSKNDS